MNNTNPLYLLEMHLDTRLGKFLGKVGEKHVGRKIGSAGGALGGTAAEMSLLSKLPDSQQSVLPLAGYASHVLGGILPVHFMTPKSSYGTAKAIVPVIVGTTGGPGGLGGMLAGAKAGEVVDKGAIALGKKLRLSRLKKQMGEVRFNRWLKKQIKKKELEKVAQEMKEKEIPLYKFAGI